MRLAFILIVLTNITAAIHAQSPVPATRRDNVKETIHGVEIVDPFRWLEDQDSPETRAWIDAQNKHTDAYLGGPETRAKIAKRLEELMRVDRIGAPIARNGKYFYTRQKPSDEQAILYVKEGLGGQERVLFDPLQLSKDHTTSASYMDVIRDGSLAAIGVRRGGEDEVETRIIDAKTLKELPDGLSRAFREQVSFKPDATGYYYSQLIPLVGRRVYYHAMGTDHAKDIEVFGKEYGAEIGVGGSVSRNGRYLWLYVQRGWSQNDIFYKDLLADSPIRPIVKGIDATFTGLLAGDKLVIQTNWKAPKSRIMLADMADPSPEKWGEIVAEGAESIDGFSLAGGKVFVSYLHDVSTKVKAFDLDGKPVGEIKLPGIGTSGAPTGEWEENEAFYNFTSFTVPNSIYRYEVSTGKSSLWSQPKVPFKAGQFETKQVWYSSKDGTRVPMFLVQKKGCKWDGNRPVLLTAYGGFNVSSTAGFYEPALVWAERGGVYAVPNLRGGGEFGEGWHKAGMMANKQNVFDDFLAAAEWLIKIKLTRPARLAIEGMSNGGLLMGAAITQRPELFGAVSCEFPLLDMVRYHKFMQGPQWTQEYGSAEDAEQFKSLYAYSPYHHAKPGVKYPPTLFTTGDSDTRVAPLHARKMAAFMQSVADTKTPILLHYDTKAGHSGGQPIAKEVEDQARVLGFLMREIGVK